MPESFQSSFELSVHFPVFVVVVFFFFSRTIFSSSSRLVRYTDKCLLMNVTTWNQCS